MDPPSMLEQGREMARVGDQLVATARGLREQLIAEQGETEERATYSAAVHETLLEAGFYRMYIPRRYGGLEVDVPTFMRVGVELARGDMGVAWGACLAANHALQVGSWFPERTQDEVFGGGDFRAASVAAPTLRATPIDGGYRLEGAVAYCSGIPYSTYYMGQAMLPDTTADGVPRMVLFVAPRSAFTQLDDWGDTLGLKGTGSHTIRFDGARLPAHYVLEDANMVDVAVEHGTPGLTLHGNPMYGGRALVIFTLSLACTLVGGGYNALDEYRNWALDKPTPLPPFGPRFQNADFQRWYGAAFVKLQTAEAAMMRCAELHMEACRHNADGTEPYTWAVDARLAAIGSASSATWPRPRPIATPCCATISGASWARSSSAPPIPAPPGPTHPGARDADRCTRRAERRARADHPHRLSRSSRSTIGRVRRSRCAWSCPGPCAAPAPCCCPPCCSRWGCARRPLPTPTTLTLSTATKAGSVYPWCGGKTLVQALQPDAAPPATPTSCSDYSPSGASGTLTAQFGAHQAGIVTASVYVHDDSRPLTALLYVDGVRAGATITAPQVRSGWLTFPSASVSASAAISVQIRAGSTGSGYARVYTVHADLTSPTTSLGQPGNWATTPLPWAVALAGGAAPNGVALTTAVPRELAGEAAADSWVNSTAYTAGIFYVPVNTALQPVRLCRFSAQCIPNWGSPAYDQWGARRTGFIVQTSGTPVSTVDPLDTLSGAYVRPTDSSWYGPDVANPGAANSTTFDSAWGVTAARTPLVADVVSQSDCQAVLNGAADFGHAIGIQLQATRNPITAGGSPWWPAGSSDGTAPGMATTEGMRVFFEPSVAMPSGLSPAAQALFHTLERYGAVVDDTTGGGPVVSNAADGSYQSGGALMLRSQLDSTATGPCATLGISSALSGIPWGKVSGPIAMGSDANANPT